jgi:biopolymer transport protein ExbB
MKIRVFAWVAVFVVATMVCAGGAFAQGGGAAAPAVAPAVAPAGGAGELVPAEGTEGTTTSSNKEWGFVQVIFGSGPIGVLLWVALFGAGGVAVYLAVDSAITVREKRIMPHALIQNVTASMAEGDVLKALHNCENEPGPLANVLTAGFSHVEEGFDVIQEAVSTAAEMEVEKIMQKLTWMSVVANLSTMLGLLGTVQGMIMAFASLGSGAPDIGLLAIAIAQALYTTAAGLSIAVPAIATYYVFRNSANRIILRMEAMTMELIKDLRNVEVVDQ